MCVPGILLSPIRVVAVSVGADEHLAMLRFSLDDLLPLADDAHLDDVEPVTYTVVVDETAVIHFSRLAYQRHLAVRVVANDDGSFAGTVALRLIEVMDLRDL